MTKEQQLISKKNRNKTAKLLGTVGTGLVLHHRDVNMKENDPERYILWLPEDLVIMTRAEHNTLHYSLDKATRVQHMKENHGSPTPGWKYTDEQRARRGERSKRIATGRHWYTNGLINKFTYECPEGFTQGRIY